MIVNKYLGFRPTLVFIIALFFCVPKTFATVVEIGLGGNDTNSYLPTSCGNFYCLSQQIYTADEIGPAGTIYCISLKNAGNSIFRHLSVYMVHTVKSDFSNKYDWISVSSTDLVFSGSVDFTSNKWVDINLDNPFVYDGSSNLLLCVVDDTKKQVYPRSTLSCLTFGTSVSQAIYKCRDSNPFDVNSLSDNADVQFDDILSFKNQVKFYIAKNGESICPIPNLIVGDVLSNSATLTWNGGSGNYNVEYRQSGSASWSRLLTATNKKTYTLTGLTSSTTYEVKVQSVCDGSVTSYWYDDTFTTTAVATEVGNYWSDDFEGSTCSWTFFNYDCKNTWNW